jgi:hypothetical protein
MFPMSPSFRALTGHRERCAFGIFLVISEQLLGDSTKGSDWLVVKLLFISAAALLLRGDAGHKGPRGRKMR